MHPFTIYHPRFSPLQRHHLQWHTPLFSLFSYIRLIYCFLVLSFSHISLHLYPLFSPLTSILHQPTCLKWLITVHAFFKMQTSLAQSLPLICVFLAFFLSLFFSHIPLSTSSFLSKSAHPLAHALLSFFLPLHLSSAFYSSPIILLLHCLCFHPSFGSNCFLCFLFFLHFCILLFIIFLPSSQVFSSQKARLLPPVRGVHHKGNELHFRSSPPWHSMTWHQWQNIPAPRLLEK